MIDGWPARAGRSNFGQQDMADERLTVDPTRELNAKAMNLLFWQVGALGIVSPKACFLVQLAWEDEASHYMHFGRFAWDDTAYDDVLYADFPPYMAAIMEGQGQYRFEFDATVPGRDGELQTLEVRAAVAKPVAIQGESIAVSNQRGHAEVITTTPAAVRTLTRKSVNQTGAAVNMPVLVVLF